MTGAEDPGFPVLLKLALVAALIATNAMFVAFEFALVRAHPSTLKGSDYQGRLGVTPALQLLEDLDLSLSASQLGITIVSLVLGWWGEQTFQAIFLSGLQWIGEPGSAIVSHSAATVAAFTMITFLHVVLGELVAKAIAIRSPEAALRVLAGPCHLFFVCAKPIVRFLTHCSTLCLKLLGITQVPDTERIHSVNELAMLVTHSTQKGLLDKTEEAMLQGVFGFSETVAREIMTPRTDLVTIPVTASIDQVVDTFIESGFSRLPVIGETVDDVIGLVLVRDVFPVLPQWKAHPEKPFSVRRIMRDPYFVPGTKPIDDLLNEFKRRNTHMAVVLDEHGGVDGVVSLEDVLEEIVGDIFDESDIPQNDVVVEESGDILLDGGVLVSEINEKFQTAIPEGDYDTIAGFIYTSLGRMPRAGDEVAIRTDGSRWVNGEPLDSEPRTASVPEPDISPSEAETEASKAESSPATPNALRIIVEKIRGRRIETVRLIRFIAEKVAESETAETASEPEEGKSEES